MAQDPSLLAHTQGCCPTGSGLAVHSRPGSVGLRPPTTTSQMPEVRPTSQLRGDQELLPVVVRTSMIAPRHTHGAEKNTVSGLPAPRTSAKFKVTCQDPPG